MSLSSEKQKAISDLESLLTEMRSKTELSDQEFSRRFIGLLFTWISKAQVKYTTGLVAGANPVTGTFNGNIE
ncbi:hypothetical protein ATE49_04745 [Elizabethkingia miricola]|uniref:Uncharacterized protein n=1 Tax=Elizabethkingia miricola TaxID=172045 RepID=A0ABY3NG74_ELIMR|nr:hypothetical protein [Elizabethkingia miricola]OBS12535.1 hypothetical protein ATE49_04745 [Elizabethkingia miricola]TYO91990.1 hypothetical protein LX74_02241 [Elizabethkingia miricola]